MSEVFLYGTGGGGKGEDLEEVLTEQEELIESLKEALENKIAVSKTDIVPLTVTENGTYTAPEGQAYSPVEVNVAGSGGEYGKLCEEDYYEEGCVKLIVDMPVPIPVTVRFRQNNDHDIVVDWGDGSTNSYTYSGNGQRPSHTYTTAGIKVIKLIPTENATRLQLGVTSSDYLFGENSSTSSYGLRKMYIGTPIASLTGTGGASGMTHVVIGKVKSMGTQAFYGSTVLQALDIPEGLTSVSSGLCFYCYGLLKVTLPKTITTVYANAFDTCSRLLIVDFSKCESVPSLSSSSFMTACSYGQILVPSALYDEWINATNWSAVASKIVAV